MITVIPANPKGEPLPWSTAIRKHSYFYFPVSLNLLKNPDARYLLDALIFNGVRIVIPRDCDGKPDFLVLTCKTEINFPDICKYAITQFANLLFIDEKERLEAFFENAQKFGVFVYGLHEENNA